MNVSTFQKYIMVANNKPMEMKITIETDPTGAKPTYKIKVSEGNDLIHEKIASSIEERDGIVWKLTELYDIVDIEFITMNTQKIKQKLKLSEVPVIDYTSSDDLIAFIDENSHLVCSRILEAIEEGVFFSLDKVDILQLGDTGATLSSSKKDWINGLETAIKYFESTSDYEGCMIASSLIKQLYNETDPTNLCD